MPNFYKYPYYKNIYYNRQSSSSKIPTPPPTPPPPICPPKPQNPPPPRPPVPPPQKKANPKNKKIPKKKKIDFKCLKKDTCNSLNDVEHFLCKCSNFIKWIKLYNLLK